MAGGQSAAAVWLAEGEGGGGDATDGAILGSGAAANGCHQYSGDHIIDLGTQAGPDKRRDLNECCKESGNFIVNTSD